MAWPAQSMPIQTGIRTIASVFILNLKAEIQLIGATSSMRLLPARCLSGR